MSAPVVDSPFAKDTWVRIVGQQGVFKVMRSLLNPDGSLTLYGGDKNPRGHRGYRAVMPSRLVETSSPYGDREEES